MGRKEHNVEVAVIGRSACRSTRGRRAHRTVVRFAKESKLLLVTRALLRRLLGCFGSRRVAVFTTCAAFGATLVGASGAEASATQFTAGLGCLPIQVGQHVQNNTGYPLLQGLLDDTAPTVSGGALVQVPRPVKVYGYRGTAGLYWAPTMRLVQNSTGAWAQAQLNGYGARPWTYVWHVSRGWFTNLWWNQQSPQTNVQFYVPPGFTAYVWSTTYWLNSRGAWFYRQYQYYGGCRA